MTRETEAELRARIAELEAQNAELQRSLEFVRQDRKICPRSRSSVKKRKRKSTLR